MLEKEKAKLSVSWAYFLLGIVVLILSRLLIICNLLELAKVFLLASYIYVFYVTSEKDMPAKNVLC